MQLFIYNRYSLPFFQSMHDKILFNLNVSVVTGLYDLCDPEWDIGVPQKSFINKDESGADGCKS